MDLVLVTHISTPSSALIDPSWQLASRLYGLYHTGLHADRRLTSHISERHFMLFIVHIHAFPHVCKLTTDWWQQQICRAKWRWKYPREMDVHSSPHLWNIRILGNCNMRVNGFTCVILLNYKRLLSIPCDSLTITVPGKSISCTDFWAISSSLQWWSNWTINNNNATTTSVHNGKCWT